MNAKTYRTPARIGADGTPPSAKDLPCVRTVRWVPSRKRGVVDCVRAGVISAEDACARYGLTGEELDAWIRAFERRGPDGLYVTRRGRAPLAGEGTEPAPAPSPPMPRAPRRG